MGSNTKPEAAPEAIKQAQKLWGQFTVGVKYGTIATVAILALMALTLL